MLTKRAFAFARPVIAIAALSLALTGCTGSVDDDELESTISSKLEEQVGTAPDEVDCPDDLPGKKGAKMTCILRVEGQSIDVKVNVTSVEDGDINYSYEVAKQPN